MSKLNMKKESSIVDVKKPDELTKIYQSEPEPIFYWRGIEDVSFGYIFGPSKVGKTIFCENLAMSLAVGRTNFFNSEMIGKPKRVFFAALEEDYRNRTRRMRKQLLRLTDEELILYNKNMNLAGPTFPRFINSVKEWLDFEKLVHNIKPVIVDSLTRIVNTDITSRDACKDVLARLRNFAYDNSICLIVIHHANKLSGGPLTMESMAGSSIMSQEADFSIGLNRNELTNERYLKEVFYRYEEPKDMVTSYKICNESNWLDPLESVYESKVLLNTGEKSASYYEKILKYLKAKAEKELLQDDKIESYTIEVSELKKEFVSNSTIPSRSFDYTLKNIVKNRILVADGRMGNYVYNI